MPKSKFEGSVFGLFGMQFLVQIITIFTLGFGLPWAICMYRKWLMKNTYINGRRLKFTGTGGDLFLKFLGWFLLTLITLGIYGFWANRNIIRWIVEHIEFDDEYIETEDSFETCEYVVKDTSSINEETI